MKSFKRTDEIRGFVNSLKDKTNRKNYGSISVPKKESSEIAQKTVDINIKKMQSLHKGLDDKYANTLNKLGTEDEFVTDNDIQEHFNQIESRFKHRIKMQK